MPKPSGHPLGLSKSPYHQPGRADGGHLCSDSL